MYNHLKLNSNVVTSDNKEKTLAVRLSPALQVVHWTIMQTEPVNSNKSLQPTT